MKNLVLLILLTLLIPVSFAQQCKTAPDSSVLNFILLSRDTLTSTCKLEREQYKCDELEAELEGEDKKKIIQCDLKSIEENKLSNISLGTCLFNGLQISVDNLKSLAQLPGQIAESIVKGFHENKLCNNGIEKKRELLNAFNITIEDERFKLSEQFLGRWLEEASCSEIDKLLSARYENYQNTLARERIAAINTGKKPKDLEQNKNNGELLKKLSSVFEAANIRLHCYSSKAKAEMLCAGITSLLVDAATGVAVTKIVAIVKSKKALSNINRAVASGEKIDLKDASKLLKGDRIKAAERVLSENGIKRELTKEEKDALILAHEVGKPQRGYFTYTKEDIAKKADYLKAGGFTAPERRILMEAGIAGEIADPFYVKAVLTHFKKVLGQESLEEVKSAAILKIEGLPLTSSEAFLKANPKQILKDAGFTPEEIEAIITAKRNEEKRLSQGLPYKDPVTLVLKTAKKASEVTKSTPVTPPPVTLTTSSPVVPTKTIVSEASAPVVVNHAERAGKLGSKEALQEADKLVLPRDAKGQRLKVNGKDVIASPKELEAASEYYLRASRLEREAAEEAYKKKNRTYNADVSIMNRPLENALESSFRGDGSVAQKIVKDALESSNHYSRNINEVVDFVYNQIYLGSTKTEAETLLKKENVKKFIDELKLQKGEQYLTNGNSSLIRNMYNWANSN